MTDMPENFRQVRKRQQKTRYQGEPVSNSGGLHLYFCLVMGGHNELALAGMKPVLMPGSTDKPADLAQFSARALQGIYRQGNQSVDARNSRPVPGNNLLLSSRKTLV